MFTKIALKSATSNEEYPGQNGCVPTPPPPFANTRRPLCRDFPFPPPKGCYYLTMQDAWVLLRRMDLERKVQEVEKEVAASKVKE